jgi:hypothetical protein
MFDQLMKRSNWVWVYKMGRFAEERRASLCDLNKRGHSLPTLPTSVPGQTRTGLCAHPGR